jgi:hypothetical protein
VVNPQTRSVKISTGAGSHAAKVTGDSKIRLDNSKMKKSNTTGAMENCQSGLRCEVKYKYQGQQRWEEAEWIKIEITGY